MCIQCRKRINLLQQALRCTRCRINVHEKSAPLGHVLTGQVSLAPVVLVWLYAQLAVWPRGTARPCSVRR